MEKEKAEVFPHSSLMTDETKKNPEDTGTTHTPSVLDEIAAEEAQSPPDDKEQATPAAQQPQDAPADTGTDEKEPQGAEAVPEENLEDQYKTLQEKIADVDKLLNEAQSPKQETTTPADAAQSEEKGEAPEQAETAPATDAEETADTPPPPLATAAEETPQTHPDETAAGEAAGTESSLPDREAPPTEAHTTPEAAQEETHVDAQLKTKLFEILDGTHPEHEAPPETATAEIQDSEPLAENATSAEEPPEPVAETPDEVTAETSDETAVETSDEAAPPRTTESEETPPPPEAAPEPAKESGAEPEPAPKPAYPDDSPPASGTEAFSILMPEVEFTSPEKAAPPFTLKMLYRPGELMSFFERTLDKNENIRTAWLVFGCISLGVAGLALLMWLFSSM